MKHTKDLSRLSVPAFLLIVGLLILAAFRQNNKTTGPDTSRLHELGAVVQK
ncbi:MAG TPA: hypothetical protein VG890_13065 [Puia sp.]|nr:hypothetical protein [Puia sp.]